MRKRRHLTMEDLLKGGRREVGEGDGAEPVAWQLPERPSALGAPHDKRVPEGLAVPVRPFGVDLARAAVVKPAGDEESGRTVQVNARLSEELARRLRRAIHTLNGFLLDEGREVSVKHVLEAALEPALTELEEYGRRSALAKRLVG